MATAGGPLGDTLHAPVYADLGPQVLVVLFKMSALSVRGGCPLVSFPSYIYSPEAASWFSIWCIRMFCRFGPSSEQRMEMMVLVM